MQKFRIFLTFYVRSSSLYYVAVRMGALGYKRYGDMFNRGYSNEEIKITMMQDFIQKYDEGDKDFCLIMLDNMAKGSRDWLLFDGVLA